MKTLFTVNRAIESTLELHYETEMAITSLKELTRIGELDDIKSFTLGGVDFSRTDFPKKVFEKILEAALSAGSQWDNDDILRDITMGGPSGIFKESQDYDMCLSDEIDLDELKAEYEEMVLNASLANCQAITTKQTASI